MRAVGAKFGALEALIRDHGLPNEPRRELARMLCCGLLSPAMHQFLSASLGAPPAALNSPTHILVSCTTSSAACHVRSASQVHRGAACMEVCRGDAKVKRVLRAGEAGVKRLAKAVDGSAARMHALLAEHLAPALDAVAFQLGELHGLARCARWATPLGLSVSVAWRPDALCSLEVPRGCLG